jgi:hypothetical protein
MSQTKRTVATSVGSACFAAAFIVPAAVLPYAQTTPMLITVGLAAPAGLGYSVWQWMNYVAARLDVRVQWRPEPERELKESLL